MSEGVAVVEEGGDARSQVGILVGDEGEAIVEDVEFVGKGVGFGGGDGGVMEFVGEGGDAVGEGNACIGGQYIGGGDAGDFALEPHVPVGDDTQGFGDGEAVRTIGSPALIPESLLDFVAVPIGAFGANFAQEYQGAIRGVELILNQGTASWLVADQGGRSDFTQVGDDGLELRLGLVLVKGIREKRNFGVQGSCAEGHAVKSHLGGQEKNPGFFKKPGF
jgi:hypothetical protein